MFGLIDTEKAFNKIQHPFIIKMLSKLEIDKNFLIRVKNIYNKNLQPSMGKAWYGAGVEWRLHRNW